MSNFSSCIFILTQLFGFDKSDNDEKLTLPDEVLIDTLIEFKNFLQQCNIQNKLNDQLSSYEINESFWSCNYCTYNNPINTNTCKMCALPQNVCVCVNQSEYFILTQELDMCFVCIILVNKKKQTHSLQVDNDKNRNVRHRLGICARIQHKNVTDDELYKMICYCCANGWTEELRLAANVPRSSVEHFDVLIGFV